MHDTTIEPRLTLNLTVSEPLRARDVVILVRTAMRYAADISVTKHGLQADGKSCFDLLDLDARPGDTLQIIAQGDDAREAIDAFGAALAAAVGEIASGRCERTERVDKDMNVC